MKEIEMYIENKINNGVEKRNSTFINFVEGNNLITATFNGHSSNDGDHPINTSSNSIQSRSNIYSYGNNDENFEYEVENEAENEFNMLQYTNNDSYEGLSGYESFCDKNT